MEEANNNNNGATMTVNDQGKKGKRGKKGRTCNDKSDTTAKKNLNKDINNTHAVRWDKMFARLAEYKKRHGTKPSASCAKGFYFSVTLRKRSYLPTCCSLCQGHCLVPNRCKEDPALGSWGKAVMPIGLVADFLVSSHHSCPDLYSVCSASSLQDHYVRRPRVNRPDNGACKEACRAWF
jgi:hypothetical protein